jgi:hypothetical protein
MSACVDQEFDIPPGRDVQIEDISNTTIAELKDNFIVGQPDSYTIPEGTIIKGVVVSNDEAGNFFKTLVIQDGTAGIHVSLDAFDLFVDYPPGRTVYIRGGLELGEFAGLPTIGVEDADADVARVPEAIINQFLVVGELVEMPAPVVRTISSLGPEDLSTLIQIDEAEMAASELGNTYGETTGTNGQNRLLQDCNGSELVLRNSDFSDFAGTLMPEGNGSIVGVYTVFGNTDQFVISDTDAVQFTGDRCDGSIGGGGPTGDRISAEDLRLAFANGATTASDGFLQGIVISDVDAGNTTNLNVVVQDGDFGIVVRFTDAHTFPLGSEIKVSTTGITLSEFNGLLQLEGAQLGSASFEGSGNTVTPRELTIAEINDDFENLESTLVRINMATISGGPTFDGNLTVADATDNISIFTRSFADFSADAVPTGELTVTAMVSQFTDQQLILRNRGDVTGGGTGTGGSSIDLPHSESFDSGIPSSWTSINLSGSRSWIVEDFDNVSYATNDAFNGMGNPILDVVSWLITPEIDFDAQTGETLELRFADAFENGNPFTVYYSTDYSGTGNPENANWTQIGDSVIEPLINNPDFFDNIYESTGAIDLSAPIGTGHVAFVYNSAGGTISTTIQISDVIFQ